LDLTTANPDKVHAAFAFEAQHKLSTGAKKFWRFQPSAGIETCALTLLLSFVITSQGYKRVVTVILHDEPLPIFQIVGVRHKFSFVQLPIKFVARHNRILILQGNGGVRKSFIAALLAYSIGR